MDVTEFTHAGKKRWGLVFYGVKSKLLAYYRIAKKNTTARSTLYALGQFIFDHGIPRHFTTDSHSVLGEGKQ